MTNHRKITRSEKKLFFITSFALALVIAFGAWRQWVDAIPQVDIPILVMPQQNAFDVYVGAGKVLTQHQLIGYAVEDTMPIPVRAGTIPEKTRLCTSSDRLAILAANAVSLTIFQQGLKLDYKEPANRSREAQFPYYNDFRNLTRLLIIQGREYECRRNWRGAANEYLLALEFGADVSDNAVTLVGWLVGHGCESLARKSLKRIINNLSAPDLRNVLARLKKRDEKRSAFERILLEEGRFSQACILETFHDRNWAQQFSIDFDFDIASTNWKKVARLQTIGKRGFFDDYRRAMNLAIEDAKLPYTKRHVSPDPNSISYGYQPDFPRHGFVDARSKTDHILLTTELALRLYKIKSNCYPDSLGKLVPRYLMKVPADPFGGGEELHYKISGKKYTLYSIGPDGIDNHGHASEQFGFPKGEHRRFSVQFQSKGDFVAGINH